MVTDNSTPFGNIGGTAGTHSGPTGDDYSNILFGYDGLTTDFVNREVKNLNPLYPTYFQFSSVKKVELTFKLTS